MGKRSNFDHREADFYPTPLIAVPPLIPYLRGIRTFAEPCAGEGDLVRHLESFGFRCIYAGDISTGQNAFDLTHLSGADACITNPPRSLRTQKPFDCELMHGLLEHFLIIAPTTPTWLLAHHDWSATEQAAPYLLHCSDIVVVSRLKWIEGTPHTGKDDHAWYRFDARHHSGPALHNNRGHRGGVILGRSRAYQKCRQLTSSTMPIRTAGCPTITTS
jgi:hypothetical protein